MLISGAEKSPVRAEVAKSRRRRRIPILPRTATLLKAMFAERLSPYVWTTEYGDRYTPNSSIHYRSLQKAVKLAGIDEHVEWHDLRRTCGCRLLQDHKMSMEQVSLWLGHSSVKVTEQRYAFLRVDDLHTAIREAPENVVELDFSQGYAVGTEGKRTT